MIKVKKRDTPLPTQGEEGVVAGVFGHVTGDIDAERDARTIIVIRIIICPKISASKSLFQSRPICPCTITSRTSTCWTCNP